MIELAPRVRCMLWLTARPGQRRHARAVLVAYHRGELPIVGPEGDDDRSGGLGREVGGTGNSPTYAATVCFAAFAFPWSPGKEAADHGAYGRIAEAAWAEGIELVVVMLSEARKGFVLLPKRWVVERSFAWTARFRRLARDYERLPETLAGLHGLAFVGLMMAQLAAAIAKSS